MILWCNDEEIPSVWRAASLSTLGSHANWPGGILVSSQEEGLIVISGSSHSQSNCVSVYCVQSGPAELFMGSVASQKHSFSSWSIQIASHDTSEWGHSFVYEGAVLPSSADGSAIPQSLPFLPFSGIGLCIKCHRRWIFLSVTLSSIIPFHSIQIG